MMGDIAIIGTEGSGKTILLTALAKRFELPSKSGVFLEPVNRKTADYVDNIWDQLKSGGWPKGTEPGASHELRWRLHAGKDRFGELLAIDPAGQDLRGLFDNDQDVSATQLTQSQRDLLQFLRSVETLVFLLNMQDFMAEADDNRRRSNEWTLKRGMDSLLAAGPRERRRHCLVFTQADLYPSVPSSAELRDLVRRYLPKVYAAHLQEPRVPLFTLAAVNKTRVAVRDGKPRRVPAEDFGSTGLEHLMDWLSAPISDAKSIVGKATTFGDPFQRRVEDSLPARSPTPSGPAKPDPQKSWWERLGGLTGLAIVFWLFSKGCFGGPAPNDKLHQLLEPRPNQTGTNH